MSLIQKVLNFKSRFAPVNIASTDFAKVLQQGATKIHYAMLTVNKSCEATFGMWDGDQITNDSIEIGDGFRTLLAGEIMEIKDFNIPQRKYFGFLIRNGNDDSVAIVSYNYEEIH